MCINNATKPKKQYRIGYKVVIKTKGGYKPEFQNGVTYRLGETVTAKTPYFPVIDNEGFHLFLKLENANSWKYWDRMCVVKCRVKKVLYGGELGTIGYPTIIAKTITPIKEM